MNTRFLAFAAALVLTGVTLAPAVSADTVEERTQVVYTDLDLATEEGRSELASRIDRAAKQICGFNDPDMGTRVRSRSARQCYDNTVEAFETRFATIIRDAQRGG